MKRGGLLVSVVLGLGILFQAPVYASDSSVEAVEGSRSVLMAQVEESITKVQESILEASRRLDEDQARIDEIRLLAQLIEAEAGNQDLHGRMLVGNVVLNRVRSPRWPNDLWGVISQKGQFEVMRNGAFDRAGRHISETSMEAARMAYRDIFDPNIMYFATYKANGRGHWKHGGHWFSY